jgi:hypothetical protein
MDARERGQVAPLLALFAVGAGLAALGLGRIGAQAVDHARARTAADAAALAAAGAGAGPDDQEVVARRYAAANGATVETFESAGDDVRVRVRAGVGTASARARSSGAARDPQPHNSAVGLAPAMRAALARAAQVLGEPVPVSSGFRSAADQQRLWAERSANRYPVAPPGSSMHERGLAVDVPLRVADRLAELSTQTGLCRPYPRTDPVHFELC